MMVATLLSGCAVYSTERTKIWIICYQDDTILPNGMYETNELRIKCNGRKQLQFTHKVGTVDKEDKLTNGLKEYIKEH